MGEITGRQVFAVTAGAFSIIIAVNLTMAWKAVSTFPGLEVQNGYIASQTFDVERKAQEALGWTLTPSYRPGALALDFVDAQGDPVVLSQLDVLVGRTTEAREDSRPEFHRSGGAFVADVTLAKGKWMLKVEARAADGTLFRQRLHLSVRD
jgi:nitrogen fixation protein FixH